MIAPLLPLTILYFILPLLLFALGWLKSPLAEINTFLIAYTVFVASRDLFRWLRAIYWPTLRSNLLLLLPAFIILTIWLFLSGVGGFGFQNVDYRTHNALLHDLIVQEWPLMVSLNGVKTFIVYYMGYYLPAAWIGKRFGWTAANDFLFIWTWVGVILSFVWFWKTSAVNVHWRMPRTIGLALLFCLAGGLDVVGYYAMRLSQFDITNHIEWWPYYFQYSSQTTLLYWVPQQAIAAWLITGMVVDCIYEKHNLKYLGIALASAILYSPFGLIGIVPFLLLLPFMYHPKLFPIRGLHLPRLSTLHTILLNFIAVWIGCVLLFYMVSNQFKFPMGLIWHGLSRPDLDWQNLAWENLPLRLMDPKLLLIVLLLFFYLLEFGILAVVSLRIIHLGLRSPPVDNTDPTSSRIGKFAEGLQRNFKMRLEQWILFLTSIMVLLIIPLYKMGYLNDFTMRASIPSLFIFWAFIGKLILDFPLPRIGWLKFFYALIILIVLFGAFTSMGEISRSIQKYHFGAPDETSISSSATALSHNLVEQRAGDLNSFFFRHLLKSP